MLAAHGSPDPRNATVVAAIRDRVRRARPELAVGVGYLDHGEPLRTVATKGAVVVPLLLTHGHHVTADIPAQAPGAFVTKPLGPDDALLAVLARRLEAAGWTPELAVTLVAAGSAEPAALDDVRDMAARLTGRLGSPVTAAFLATGEPQLADLPPPPAVASYLLAPGRFHDRLADCGVPIVSAPIGAAPEVVATVLSRYDATSGD